MRALAIAALVGLGVAACSSSSTTPKSTEATTDTLPGKTGDPGLDASSDTGSPAPIGNGAPDCSGACCPRPQPSTACAPADEGASCSDSSRCPGGLVLPTSVKCRGGVWKREGGECSRDGGVAGNGCPDAQPTNGASCSLADGTWCQYSLSCPNTCDAGTPTQSGDGGATTGTGCASVSGKVGPAFCKSGRWETTPLGSCP